MSTYRIENVRDLQEAISFLETYQPGAEINHREAGVIAEIDAEIRTLHPHYQVPRPIWIGIRNHDRKLVAVLHASAPIEQAYQVLQAEPNLHWIAAYVTQNLLISEVSVHEDYRHQGMATALLKRAHSRAYAATGHPDTCNVTAFATTPEAASFFGANGYTIGSRQTPVPADFAGGLRSIFAPEVSAAYPEGRWTWGTLDELERG